MKALVLSGGGAKGAFVALGGTSTLGSEGDAVTLVTLNHIAVLEHRSNGSWYATGLE